MSISYCITLFVRTYGKQPIRVCVYREVYGFGTVFLVDGRYLLYSKASNFWEWRVLPKEEAYCFVHCNTCFELANTYDCVNKRFININVPHTALI